MKKTFFVFSMISTCLFAQPSIVIQVEKNIQDIGQAAAEIICNEIHSAKKKQNELAIIFPTGATPETMYQSLVKLFFEGKLDLSKTHFFNLDEYVGLSKEHQNSYAYYMESKLYQYVTPGLTQGKLAHWGFTELTKKNCYNKKLREQLNKAILHFSQELVSITKENPNTLEAFDKLVETLKQSDRNFAKLCAEFLNDRHLPSIHSLRASIQRNISLKGLCAQRKNIHLLDGQAKDLSQEVELYHKALKTHLDNPNCRVICFAGIGSKLAHIAFNDFVQEDPFKSQMITEVEKNQLALKSQTRLVALTEETRQANSHFFALDSSKTPLHALTVGFSEILACDKVFLLAGGDQKKASLYETFTQDPSYKTPSSLIKSYFRGDLHLIIDESAYGLGEENSLFSLNALDKLPNEKKTIQYLSRESSKASLWNVPKESKPCLLDKGYKIAHNNVTLAQLPKNQTVLWVKQNKIHYSLWQELKENKNKIHLTQKQEVDDLLPLIEKYQPDIIILPYTYKLVENFTTLKNAISERFKSKPILGIFYDIGPQLNNVFFPMERDEHKNKISLIHNFHHSQVSRTRFDTIAEEMSSIPSALSPFNETFSFFQLQQNGKNLDLLPFKHTTYIERKDRPLKKQEPLNTFQFSKTDVVVMIAPHPDDAEISMGGLIQFLGKENIPTHVLNATSGHNAMIKKSHALTHPYLPNDVILQIKCENSEYVESKALKSRIRECESLGALSFLNSKTHIQSLRLPFYDMPEKKITASDQRIVDEALQRATSESKGRLFFFLPYPQDSQATHRDIYKLFMERITSFCKNHPSKEVILALYPTPWTGEWNLYDYSYNQGSRLAALCGSELLTSSGHFAPKPESLGGVFANRYNLFYFNK